jgi:intracellular multiplication protein IcmE
LAANGRHPTKLLTIKELKDKGFPLDFFIDQRGDYPPRKYPRDILIAPYIQRIKDWYWPKDFKPEDFVTAKITVTQLKNEGYSVEVLINIGFTAAEIRKAEFTPEEIITGLTKTEKKLKELKALGFTIEELKKSRFDNNMYKNNQAKEFRDSYALKELKNAGFTVNDLRNRDENPGTELQKFMMAGYSLEDLLLGFDYTILVDRHYKIMDIFNALPDNEYLDKRAATFFYNNQIPVTDLKRKGFTASIMRDATISIAKILEAFTPAELRSSGFTAKELKDAGVNIVDLKVSGYSAAQLKEAEFTAENVKNAGFSVAALKEAGFSAQNVKDAGFSVAELKSAGFTASDLRSIGISVAELKSAGFTASDLRSIGITASALKSAGFDIQALRNAEFTESDLQLLN